MERMVSVYINKLPPPRDVLALDIETTGVRPFGHNILSVAFSDATDVWILLDFWLEQTPNCKKVCDILVDEQVLKLVHTVKFEYAWFLNKYGIRMKNFYDAHIVEKLVCTDQSLPMGLKDMVARYCGKLIGKATRETFFKHPGFAVRPITNDQIQYMADDVLYLHEIRDKQLPYLVDMQVVYDLEHNLTDAVCELELAGVKIDVPLWYEAVAEYDQLLAISDAAMRDMIGIGYVLDVPAVSKGVPIIKHIETDDINWNSYPQILSIFSNRFDTPLENTRAETLEAVIKLRPSDDPTALFATELLAYRKWDKRKGYNYPKYINSVTGMVHPSYHQIGADTGRFSCSKPNMQNVPRPEKVGPNLRHIWVADTEDFVIIRVDYAQQEPRVMAHMCGDPDMIKACNEHDVYIQFGRHIFGREIDKGSPERHIAKTFVLATGYGAGPKRLAETSGKPPRECAIIRKKIREAFPIMAAYGDQMELQVAKYGYVETALGRKRYVTRYSEAVNTPIQGTSADMFKLALLYVHEALTKLKIDGKINKRTRVWNLVHDEIEVHCHKDEVDIVLPLVVALMERAGKELCPSVLHIAEAEVGYRWDK